MIQIIIVFLITFILSGLLILGFISLKNMNEKQDLFFLKVILFIVLCTIISVGSLSVIVFLF
jgi:hypothetical protein